MKTIARHRLNRAIKGMVETEHTAGVMRELARLNNNLEYERFSATTGVHLCEMDAFKENEALISKTKVYLQDRDVEEQLCALAEKITREFLERERRDFLEREQARAAAA